MPGAVLNLVLPASGDTWPTWGNRVLQCLTDIKNDLEPQVVSSEININANLDFNNKSPTNAAYYGAQAGTTLAIPTNAIGMKNGEWFATDSAGNSVQVTKNGVLNVTTSGAITGTGYGSAGVELNWNSAVPVYSFFEAANTYADVRMDDLKLRNGTTAELTVTWAGSSNMTWTMPPTAGTGVSLLSVSNTGTVAHNASITTGVTFSSANITLSGTADIKHPDLEATLRAGMALMAESTTSGVGNFTGERVVTGAWTSYYGSDARVNQVGNRLKSVQVGFNKGDGSTTTLNVYKLTQTATSFPATIATNTSVTPGVGVLTATVGSPTAMAAGESIVASVGFTGSTNTVMSIRFTWDRV